MPKEEVYGELPDGSWGLLSSSDDRVFEDEQFHALEMLAFMRERALGQTAAEALDDLEQSGSVSGELQQHRTKVRDVYDEQISLVESATDLAELDAVGWAQAVDELHQQEFPDSLGQKDPAKPKKKKSKKKGKKASKKASKKANTDRN